MIQIAPSVLSANFLNLQSDLDNILKTKKIIYLHYDVMDGMFVPNLSFGASILGQIKAYTKQELILDVHLMIEQPHRYFENFVKNGADIITFHYEAYQSQEEINVAIQQLKHLGCRVGMSLKPNTPVEVLKPYLNQLDLVLIMSVEPGFGGQEFIPSALTKIVELVSCKKMNAFKFLIEVDGGINDITYNEVKNAGADIAVLGSHFFRQDDYGLLIKRLNQNE